MSDKIKFKWIQRAPNGTVLHAHCAEDDLYARGFSLFTECGLTTFNGSVGKQSGLPRCKNCQAAIAAARRNPRG